mmetsp:Transcript_45721/g.133122  ORF Transcript_45721/g.133122 Transcript_45721/m.133122 type:complete len:322 (-) Transcript_45721:6-971(-)
MQQGEARHPQPPYGLDEGVEPPVGPGRCLRGRSENGRRVMHALAVTELGVLGRVAQQDCADFVDPLLHDRVVAGGRLGRHQVLVDVRLVLRPHRGPRALQEHDLVRRPLHLVRRRGVRRRRCTRGGAAGAVPDVGHLAANLLPEVPARVLVERHGRLVLVRYHLEVTQLLHEAEVRRHHGPAGACTNERVIQRIALVQHQVRDDRRGTSRHAGAAVDEHGLALGKESVHEFRCLRPEQLDGFSADVFDVDAVVLHVRVEVCGRKLRLPHAAHHGLDAYLRQLLALVGGGDAAKEQALLDLIAVLQFPNGSHRQRKSPSPRA